MTAIFLTLAPLFIILMIGHTLRRKEFLAEGFWRNLEKLTFWALLPALFLKTMAEADFSGGTLLPAIAATSMCLATMMAILVLGRRFFPKVDGPSYSSIIQGATRFNNYVGLPVVLSLFGHEGMVVYAMIISAHIPLTNITSVWALSHYASHEPVKWRKVGKLIFTNPLILSALLGTVLSLTGIGLPPLVNEVVTAFANASLLMGLLAIGASLDLGTIHTDRAPVMASCFLKLLVYPAIAISWGLFFGLSNAAMGVMILYSSLPTATSSFILASQMGGNARLMATITATETLLAFISMPALLLLAFHWFPV